MTVQQVSQDQPKGGLFGHFLFNVILTQRFHAAPEKRVGGGACSSKISGNLESLIKVIANSVYANPASLFSLYSLLCSTSVERSRN